MINGATPEGKAFGCVIAAAFTALNLEFSPCEPPKGCFTFREEAKYPCVGGEALQGMTYARPYYNRELLYGPIMFLLSALLRRRNFFGVFLAPYYELCEEILVFFRLYNLPAVES